MKKFLLATILSAFLYFAPSVFAGTVDFIPKYDVGGLTFIDSSLFNSSSGNVGIFTSTPALNFHVAGTTGSRFSYNLTGSALDIISSSALGTKIVANYYGGIGDINITRSDSTTSILYLKESNGNVGINNPTPIYPLDVNGNSRISGYLTITSLAGAGTRMVVSDSSGNLFTQPIPSVSNLLPDSLIWLIELFICTWLFFKLVDFIISVSRKLS